MSNPESRVALVTGSSRGIGAAAAVEFGRLGYRVVVNYLSNAEAADRVVKAVEAAGGTALAVGADVRDADQSALLVRRTLDAFGRLDVLVGNANAGSVNPGPIAEMTWSDFSGKINDELRAIFFVTREALVPMTRQGRGGIIYVSSVLSEGPIPPGMVSVGVAKAAMNTFARYLATEVGPAGITVNVVSPGLVMTEEAFELPQDFVAQLAESTPLGRNAEPEDIGRFIAAVAGEDTGFMTGAVIEVAGGFGITRR